MSGSSVTHAAAYSIAVLVACIVCAAADYPTLRLRANTGLLRSQQHRYRHQRVLSESSFDRLKQWDSDERWGAFRIGASKQLLLHHESGLSGRAAADLLAAVQKAGGIVINYVPDDSWLVIASGNFAQQALSLGGVDAVSQFLPEYKVAPEWLHILDVADNDTHWSRLSHGEAVWQLSAEAGRGAVGLGRLSLRESLQGPMVQVEVHFVPLDRKDAEVFSTRYPGYDFVQAAMTDWAAPLGQLGAQLDCHIEMHVERGYLLVSVCKYGLGQVLEALAEQPAVHWLEPHARALMHNLDAATCLQGTQVSPGQTLTSPANLRPFWQAGLDGTGQVIGCGDSGVDMDSCYFFDSAVPFLDNIQTDSRNNWQYFASSTHRKVVLYLGRQDIMDGYGHGSHVAGSLLGSRQGASTPDTGTGMAPGAKLAFQDLSSTRDGSVYTPGDLGDPYFGYAYAAGARVHSDSWGSDKYIYDGLAVSADRYLYENQDFVSVFAAGNYGKNSRATTTVTSPATAKNVVAVGASMGVALSRYTSNTVAPTYMMNVSSQLVGSTMDSRAVPIVQATFGASFSGRVNGAATALVLAVPGDACASLNNANAAGAFVLAVRSSSCSPRTQAAYAQAAGAVGLVIANNVQEGYFLVTGTGPAISINVGGVPLSVGRYLQTLLSNGRTILLSFADRIDTWPSHDDIAAFSSYGPTTDGRIKPDIVGIGSLLSVDASPQTTGIQDSCPLGRQDGTSMATPTVAGNAVLVRQYFVNGFYPTGAAVAANGFTPSGPLIKAVLLGGASAMVGNSEASLPLEGPPSYRQGFGRVNLTRALPLADGRTGWSMQVVDAAQLAQGQEHQYCLRATGGAVHITLVWYDPPGLASAASALVNNLDLTVRAEALPGANLLGNGYADADNTAETVSLEDLPAGNIAITVSAPTVMAKYSPQNYSLVVLGAFSGLLASPRNPYPSAAALPAGECVITVAVIDRSQSSSALTASSALRFVFGTQSGVAPAAGFECRLATDGGDTAGTAGLHDWRACSSPYAYSGVRDEKYVFQVRAKGEQVGDSLALTVDTTPPVTTLGAAGGLAPGAATASDNLTLTFNAMDLSSVTFNCYVQVQGTEVSAASARLRTPQVQGPLQVANLFPCKSPVTLLGLGYGDWTFGVIGTDAAGNAAPAGTTFSWKGRYESGITYARVTSGPFGLTNSRTPSFALTAFTGSASGAPTAVASPAFQYQVSTGADSVPSDGSWASVSGTDVNVTLPDDGQFVFWARVAGGSGTGTDPLAVVPLAVDTQPPVVVITSKPAEYQSNPSVTVKYDTATPNDAQAYFCRWLSSNESAPDGAAESPAYQACGGNGPGASTQSNITNGFWLFQVKAQDAAGNTGAPVDVSFITDTQPPVITITTPNVTNAQRVDIEFSVADVSGTANVSCKMASTYTTPGGSLPSAADGYQQPLGSWEAGCTSPAKYVLQEGRYLFSLQAVDRANQRSQVQWVLIADYSAPSCTITSPPSGGKAYPSQVTLTFTCKDTPEAAPSGIGTTQCLLVQPGTTPPAASAALASSPPPPSSGRRLRQLEGRTGRRLAGSATYADGTGVTLGEWQNCSSPVTFNGLDSGNYTLQVRGVDRAGNTGSSSSSYVFLVDASLLTPEQQAQQDAAAQQQQQNMIIIIAAVGAGVLLVALVLGVWLGRRSIRRRRERERAAQAGRYHPGGPMIMQGPPGAPPPPRRSSAGGGPPIVSVSRAYPAVGVPPRGASMVMGPQVEPEVMAAIAAASARDQQQRAWEEEQRLRRAIAASLEEEQRRRARGTPGGPAAMDEDAQLQAALAASLAEQQREQQWSRGNP